MVTNIYYIYILYSANSDKYYVGYSTDPHRRVVEHNQKPFNTYTSKHRPWELIVSFNCGNEEKTAIKLERLLKEQKSRKLIQKLCDPTFTPGGFLAQLVRVPDIRD